MPPQKTSKTCSFGDRRAVSIYRLLIVDRVYYILSNERVMNNLIVLRN